MDNETSNWCPSEQIFKHDIYSDLYYEKFRNATFSFKKGSSDTLVCFFHGSIKAKQNHKTTTTLPVFYGVDFDFERDLNVISFSDYLLEAYKADELELSWFVDTLKIKQINDIFELITNITKLYNINNILFCGSSGGGFISVLMSCLFNQYSLISNSQFFLNQHSQWDDFAKILQNHNDMPIGTDILAQIAETKGPKQLINYCNMDDYTFKHHKPIMAWIEEKWPGSVNNVWFSGKEIAMRTSQVNHAVRFPRGLRMKSAIEIFIDSIK